MFQQACTVDISGFFQTYRRTGGVVFRSGSWRVDSAAGSRLAASGYSRNARLEGIVHHIGVALGGRPGQSLARRLVLPVSKDTLLRIVRRHAVRPSAALRVVGIDDWAWKRGQRYGTIVCDLERRRIIDLLPGRETGTVEAWLRHHPTITTIGARSRWQLCTGAQVHLAHLSRGPLDCGQACTTPL
jgi:hypothetical protein